MDERSDINGIIAKNRIQLRLNIFKLNPVIFVACNYFYIIYRFSRAEKQKLKNIVKFMPYICSSSGWHKKNIYLGPDEQFSSIGTSSTDSQQMMLFCVHYSLQWQSLFAFSLRSIQKLFYSIVPRKEKRRKKEKEGKQLGNECMNNETMGHIIHLKQSEKSLGNDRFIVSCWLSPAPHNMNYTCTDVFLFSLNCNYNQNLIRDFCRFISVENLMPAFIVII